MSEQRSGRKTKTMGEESWGILIPAIFLGLIYWIYKSGKNRLNNEAPHCSKCGTKMKVLNSNAAYRRQHDPTNSWTQYGRTLWKYSCPSCGSEKIQ